MVRNRRTFTCYLVRPYGFSDFEKKGIELPKHVKSDIKNSAMRDRYSSLVFTLNGKFVNHFQILRSSADFALIKEKGVFSRNQLYFLDSCRTVSIIE
jgi:hypothetical protein